MMTFEEMVAKNISDWIGYSGKSKSLIGREVGLHGNTVGQFAAGKALPSLKSFKKLCKSLECEYSDLLGRVEDDVI